MATRRGNHLAPSPNWYCPHISDSNTTGLLAYGARHELVILRTNVDPPVYELIENIHNDRVTAVAFSKTASNVIATGSDDCFVKVWNINSQNDELSLAKEKELKFEQKVNGITWQHESSTVLVAEGQMNIWVWKVGQETGKMLKHGIRSQPIVLACSPHKIEHVAVGFKGGILAILDVSKNGNVLLKLKGHEDDVISLSWSPKPPNQVSNSFDIASTSRDKTLRVWNLEQERYVRLVKIPQIQSHTAKNVVDASNKNRLWVTTLWIPEAENFVLCTTITGEVVQVDLSQDKKPSFVPFDTKQAGGHNRCIFNLSLCDNVLCSVSLDRQIVLYDMKQLKSTYTLSTLGGFAQCLDFSPIDIGRLAVGCGDKTVRIWCTASNSSPYLAHMLWQGINGKVTALSWHPKKENQLAFGTDEGHVGVLDASGNKPPTICRTYHKKIVYTLCWGPCKSFVAKDKVFLYSCGDGNVMIHDPSQPEKDAKNLNDYLTPKSTSKRSEISWKQDSSAVALGCEDGTVEIYSSEFQLLAVLKAQKQLVQCLRWHPISTALNPVSIYQHWLASSTYDSVIHVYDLSDVLNQEETAPKVLTQSSTQLVGHTNRVNCLSWNPHIDGRLASASYDGSVQVWNTSTVEPIGNYRGHRGLVFCVQWSASDPELLFSGGDDLSVQQFSSSTLVHTLPPPKKGKKFKKFGQGKGTVEENGEDHAENPDTLCNGEVNEQKELKKPSVSTDSAQSSTSNAAKKKKKKQAASQKSCFPICNSLDSRGKDGMLVDIRSICYEIQRTRDPEKAKILNGVSIPDLSASPNLGFFLRSSDFRKTREVEEAGHKESGNSELLFQLALWHSDIEGVLREAAKQGQLSDYLVSLAPLGCRALWLEMCHKYALQLVKEENYTKAANYFVACHKIYEAVDMLINQHCYREALALTKGRFPPTDDVFERILHAWAAKAERDGNYELVAKCHLSLYEFEHAAKCLTKRNDSASHAVAAYISAINGAVSETEDCIISCIHQALTRNEWDVAKGLLEEQQALNVVSDLMQLNIVVRVHEYLSSSLKVVQTQSNPIPLKELLEQKSGSVTLWKGMPLESGKPFLDELNEKMTTEEALKVLSAPLTLLGRLSGQRSLSSKEIIYETAVGLTQHVFPQDGAERYLDLARVLGVNYSAEPEYTILTHLCKLFFPFDLTVPLSSNSKSAGNSISGLEELVKDSFKSSGKNLSCDVNASLLAFFAANLIESLNQEASKLPKGMFLKHQGTCEECETVLQNVTSVLETISNLLKHDDFLKNENLNVKLRKLNESIAKVSATSRGNEDAGTKLQQLQKQKKELLTELELVPEQVKILPYPKIALATSKGKEVCKHLALSVQCTKTSAKIKSLADKLFSCN